MQKEAVMSTTPQYLRKTTKIQIRNSHFSYQYLKPQSYSYKAAVSVTNHGVLGYHASKVFSCYPSYCYHHKFFKTFPCAFSDGEFSFLLFNIPFTYNFIMYKGAKSSCEMYNNLSVNKLQQNQVMF
jgi:hypothetical protein